MRQAPTMPATLPRWLRLAATALLAATAMPAVCAHGRRQLAPGLGAGARPPPACREAMDGYCHSPALATCVAEVKKDGGELPLVALQDVSATSNASLWRCYSPSCLAANGTAYRRGSRCRMSCTRPELADVLQQCLHPTPPSHGREVNATVTNVWGRYAQACGLIRTPQLVKTPRKLLLFGQCRHANASATGAGKDTGTDTGNGGGTEPHGPQSPRPRLRDDMRSVRMLTTESWDGGRTWGNITVVTAMARSVGARVKSGHIDIITHKVRASCLISLAHLHVHPTVRACVQRRKRTQLGHRSWVVYIRI